MKEESKQNLLGQLKADTEIIRATAILHDIMHIPYAHTLEDENRILPKGDKNLRINKMLDRLQKELEELKDTNEGYSKFANHRIFSFLNPKEFQEALKSAIDLLGEVKKTLWTIALHDDVEDLIKKELKRNKIPKNIFKNVKNLVEEKATNKVGTKIEILDADRYYIADIIGNTISVDLISYILRDAEFTGIESKPGGWYRIFDYLRLAQDDVWRTRVVINLTKKGEWRQDVFSTIIRILNARYDLTEQVTYHHAKLSASAMLGKLAHLCKLSEDESLYEIGDEGFFSLLENYIEKLPETDCAKEGATKLLKSLKSRRLHKRFHVVTQNRYRLSKKFSKPKNRWALEKEIEERFNLLPGSIILFCPNKKVMKEASVLVVYEKRLPDGGLKQQIRPLNDPDCRIFLKAEKHTSTSDRVRNVQTQYLALWKLYVFIDPAIIPFFGAEIKQILNDTLGGSKSFDISNLDTMEEYKLSQEISEKIKQVEPIKDKRKKIFQRLPLALAQTSGRDIKENIESIRAKLDLLVHAAKDLARLETNV